eukprot:CAMPEP_0119147282 /NCGR_PEP_ID=MMETSP1310-20130426/40126_1 /TAXON_ID=464262 /ORGANISM="Genus nov. species nov., Strain RCC2339" /LENGTH=80 /DNA_ID=CAMNT_0007139235 /DNA_START=15 /DNA_END=255 /DNA_ORIENTATION=+
MGVHLVPHGGHRIQDEKGVVHAEARTAEDYESESKHRRCVVCPRAGLHSVAADALPAEGGKVHYKECFTVQGADPPPNTK